MPVQTRKIVFLAKLLFDEVVKRITCIYTYTIIHKISHLHLRVFMLGQVEIGWFEGQFALVPFLKTKRANRVNGESDTSN